LGLLSIRGPDSVRFLQGQLSNDVAALAEASADGDAPALVRAGLHSAQGRTLALLGLLRGGADQVLAVLPRELVETTRATLQRYVLRSKVTLADESDSWRIYGLTPAVSQDPAALDPAEDRRGLCVRYEGARRLLVLGAGETPPSGEPLPYEAWHAADVAAGLPQVYAPTSGQFVAQMLNLDCIGAISFTKGCYTGQEVIARAHYRGRVKRRMQRYISREPLQLSAGDSGESGAVGSFRVVDSVQHSDGRCEFLAVSALRAAASELREGAAAGGASQPAAQAAQADQAGQAGQAAQPIARHIEVAALPLPYSLPD